MEYITSRILQAVARCLCSDEGPLDRNTAFDRVSRHEVYKTSGMRGGGTSRAGSCGNRSSVFPLDHEGYLTFSLFLSVSTETLLLTTVLGNCRQMNV